MVFNILRKIVFGLALALLFSYPGSAVRAGGSFSFEQDLLPLLKQQPVMAQWLTSSLDFDETGDAIRIGQNVNPRFGGLRVGPYTILARPKGAAGLFTFEVTVETELICLDKTRKPVDVSEAVTIKEKFASVTVKPYRESK